LINSWRALAAGLQNGLIAGFLGGHPLGDHDCCDHAQPVSCWPFLTTIPKQFNPFNTSFVLQA